MDKYIKLKTFTTKHCYKLVNIWDKELKIHVVIKKKKLVIVKKYSFLEKLCF